MQLPTSPYPRTIFNYATFCHGSSSLGSHLKLLPSEGQRCTQRRLRLYAVSLAPSFSLTLMYYLPLLGSKNPGMVKSQARKAFTPQFPILTRPSTCGHTVTPGWPVRISSTRFGVWILKRRTNCVAAGTTARRNRHPGLLWRTIASKVLRFVTIK